MHSIAFLLGGVEISGGINVIFQHAMYLSKKGYSVSFVTSKPVYPSEIKWHPLYEFIKNSPDGAITWYTFNDLNNISFDFAIATWWRTYFHLWKVTAGNYLYFVQSIESRFYPSHEIALRSVVESTYELDNGYITECNWISQYLHDNYGHEVPVAPNGIDKDVFNLNAVEIESRDEHKLRVLIEGPVDVQFKNVPATINIVKRSMADEVWLLTSSGVSAMAGIDRVFSRIPLQFTPAVYKSCDLIIKLSYVEGMFGPPLEMFHCGGTCIVYDVTGHDEYVQHKKNGIVVKTDSEQDVVNYLNELRENRNVLANLKEGAIKTAELWPDWSQSSELFEKAILKAALKATVSHELLKRYSKRIWHIYEYKYT